MQELKEAELLELIKSGELFVLKVFMDDCSFCTEYEPIFAEAAKNRPNMKFVSFNLPARSDGGSTFKRNYMKANGKERIAAPATFIFDKGEMKYRQYGKMSAQELAEFIVSGKAPEKKVDQRELARQELINLFAKKGEIVTLAEELPILNQRIGELRAILDKQG